MALGTIVISTLAGLIYGYLFDTNSTITRINFNNTGVSFVLWQIISHNFLNSIVVICLSIFFYIGPSIPVIITYFVFGDSFAVVFRKNGLLIALGTYPHFILESIQILIILAIAFKISRKILDSVFSKYKNHVKKDGLLINFCVANIFLILAAIVEVIRLRA
ncbi:stage II sporulation protein M [Clostridium sp. Marseille-Q2269]|uniref:stage II sporulation protein M n=1 Tax=Clostridium sp. Marseille-Q2269 TaxID=2942205 RepID=UPI002073B3E1|nr:stage II sporulation protein M [Clostridium sp. Marseille-Q2269]